MRRIFTAHVADFGDPTGRVAFVLPREKLSCYVLSFHQQRHDQGQHPHGLQRATSWNLNWQMPKPMDRDV